MMGLATGRRRRLHADPAFESEVGWRVAIKQSNEDEGWGPWVNPRIFEMNYGSVHVKSSAETHPWFRGAAPSVFIPGQRRGNQVA